MMKWMSVGRARAFAAHPNAFEPPVSLAHFMPVGFRWTLHARPYLGGARVARSSWALGRGCPALRGGAHGYARKLQWPVTLNDAKFTTCQPRGQRTGGNISHWRSEKWRPSSLLSSGRRLMID